ncbi:hypothetical protein [Bradyrhizobium sp. LTSP857]|uniref:hypothetical protein n=1 Tax=Bradyrhizobium sp. LTSP857 TaxID=1619231 RepID=UPI0012E064A7|nr:hypothetical protein [Bradyrhizobium sp. LTSP857]
MLPFLLQRWRVRKLPLICPNCFREASSANLSRGRAILIGDLTCEYCGNAADVAGWRLAAQARNTTRSVDDGLALPGLFAVKMTPQDIRQVVISLALLAGFALLLKGWSTVYELRTDIEQYKCMVQHVDVKQCSAR